MQTKFDLIVVGGGFAGTAAAIAAARLGQDTLLIERDNCLGGAACNALVNPFMPFWTMMPETGERRALCNGIFREVLDELKHEGGLDGEKDYSMVFDEEILKLVLNRMALRAGVKLLFHANLCAAHVQDGRIVSVACSTVGGMLTLSADRFIDATGDAELSAISGCEFQLGRAQDHLCQPMTLCFRMGGVDKEKFRKNRAKITPLYQKLRAEGKISNPREDVLIFDNMNDGVLHFNSTRIVRRNPNDAFDVTQAEIDAREQVYELHRFLKENIEGFENSRVLSTAMHIGARESRMVMGDYVLTAEDLKAYARFDDAIAAGNYDIDIHNPEGTGTSHYFFENGKWYTIPYRSLVVKGMENLLVAGRCISSTHEAQASYRVMPIVCCIGEAAGTAAGVAGRDGTTLRGVNIAEVQRILRAGGAPI